MSTPVHYCAITLLFLTLATSSAGGQGMGGMGTPAPNSNGLSITSGMDLAASSGFFMMRMNSDDAQKRHEQLEQPSEGVSKLDLKAPGKAKKEYDRGINLLLATKSSEAVEHLSKATAIYPKFVAAHDALGSAYLDVGQLEKARDEFEQAISLDDHLPNPYAHLCTANLALKRYPEAEQAIKKASSIAPLKIDLLTVLTYAQLQNHNYQDAIATAERVHTGKHENAAMIHMFAAAAWREQKNLTEMQRELETFLAEDPKNPSADHARQLIAQIKEIQSRPKTKTAAAPAEPTAAQVKEAKQVTEAEAMCVGCGSTEVTGSASSDVANGSQTGERIRRSSTGWVLRKNVDEIDLFLAVTDHGKPVTDLRQEEVAIRDDGEPPLAILAFRNQSELPLRLALLIDTSESVTGRFSFEQNSAANFLQKVSTNKEDLAFVVGFANQVLLVQDYTADQKQLSHGISELTPAGGTALWDAVTFAAQQLGNRAETAPVARILVVISDGEDNSSAASLKDAILAAERANVIVYTISTAETTLSPTGPPVGTKALKVLAEQTGGSSFVPGSAGNLKRGLADLQEVIRSRYLISYKPARFELDGHYRRIEVTTRRSGHKLRLYARKGYVGRVLAPGDEATLDSDSSHPAVSLPRK
jgi:Ca-activated chloride channel homolog